MSAAIDSAVTELRNSKAALTAAENETSRLNYEIRSAEDIRLQAEMRFNAARVSLADIALEPEQ